MTVTVVGSDGYIGSQLVQHLREAGTEVLAIGRDNKHLYDRPLGNLIYCVGVTTDFQDRPFDTVQAHVGLLSEILQKSDFQSLTYLSSTRVYMKETETAEASPIKVHPSDPNYLYNTSKLLGENLCVYSKRPAKVIRLSNVYGFDKSATTFLPQIIQQALKQGRIELETSLLSAKDYISLHAAISLIADIARNGKQQAYNLAAGKNISHGEIVDVIAKATGCKIKVRENAPAVIFPVIDIARIEAEFTWPDAELLQHLPGLIEQYRSL